MSKQEYIVPLFPQEQRRIIRQVRFSVCEDVTPNTTHFPYFFNDCRLPAACSAREIRQMGTKCWLERLKVRGN